MAPTTDAWLIRKRDGRRAEFDPARIHAALEKAFRAEQETPDGTPLDAGTAAEVDALTREITDELAPLAGGGPVDVERVQDFAELGLMRRGHYRAARRYIVYRAEHAKLRALRSHDGLEDPAAAGERPRLSVTLEDGTRVPFDPQRARKRLAEAAADLGGDVNVDELLEDVLRSVFDGISTRELYRAMILAARSRIERDPAYDTVAGRLMRMVIHNEALGRHEADPEALAKLYRHQFEHYLIDGVAAERLDPLVRTFDTPRLAAALKPERDGLFKYLGLQTIYDRYLLHIDGRRIEAPQFFWMRVAMGLASGEGDWAEGAGATARTDRAIEFYEVLSDFRFTSATPTLFNSATLHPQLSSCYLTTVQDDLDHIFKSVQDNAKLSKWAGGLGNDWTNIRATGSLIKGTNGRSQGVIPFLKVVSDTAVAVNQCFAPDTGVFTADGVKPIAEVEPGDLVLGQRGEYREVLEHYTYDQPDAASNGGMVELDVKHSVHTLRVTAGHPLWAVCGVPMEQAIDRTERWLAKGKVAPAWVEAGELAKGDYVAQVVPREVVPVDGFTAEDARLLGILLGDGHLACGTQWGVSGHPGHDEHLQFVRDYLDARGVHYWESGRGETCAQVHWATGRGVVRDGTTGRIVGAGAPTLPFGKDDLYDAAGNKRIGRRFTHLPPEQTRALLKGLLETDGGVSRGKEIYFTTTSRPLADGVRYQCLRLGVPVAGQYREREQDHDGLRGDGSIISFRGVVKAFDLRIPAVPGLAELVGAKPLTKRNWFHRDGCLFTRVRSAKSIEPTPTVHDLKVEGDETYMTTSALVHNGGKRKGAVCSYLETWHADLEEFLDLRRNTGDDRRRTHDMHTANWIPDLFMQRVEAHGTWTLFTPSDVPDLHDLYGRAFKERYEHYERLAEAGKLPLARTVPALDLWRKMLTRLFETGHPWVTFKDPSNIRSPQDHAGVVHSSNLCCMTADQRVVTDRGLLTVGELYDLECENLVVGRQGVERASRMVLPRPDAPIVEVQTREGYAHKVTPDHKVWKRDHGWVEAQHLVPGDRIEIQQVEGLWGPEDRVEAAFLCGLIAGDGTFGQETVYVDVWDNAIHERVRIEHAAATVIRQADFERVYAPVQAYEEPTFNEASREGDNFRKLRLGSRSLYRALETFGFTRETKRRVPEFVWRGSRATVSAYLEGLYLADGTTQGGEVTVSSLASADREFLREVQILWANFGVKSSMNQMRDAGRAMLPDGRGGTEEYDQQSLYRLLVTSVRGNRVVEEVTRIGHHRRDMEFLRNLNKSGYRQKLWATFTGLEQLPSEDAYCLTVDSEEHSWTVNGLVTKNTEILLNTSEDETAVCNLGSINLRRHITEYEDGSRDLDRDLLADTIRTAVRMLDNVIDINFYPTEEAKTANNRHRPVGLGIMGFQDALAALGLSYASDDAARFADESMELISFHAIQSSSELAAERGPYPTYQQSKWDRGLFPLDTLKLLDEQRGERIDVDRSASLDWTPVREHVAKHGMRNSNVMAIAPTATISTIIGVAQSIEPMYKHLYVKSNLSGDFTQVNIELVQELKDLGIWDADLLEQLKYYDGALSEITRIPEHIRAKYLTAFEVDPRWILECAARRQKWIDQGQSLNLYMSGPSGKKLHDIYFDAWRRGLKTTYYLRTLAATQVEKSTVDVNRFGVQPRWMKSKSASGDIAVNRDAAPVEDAIAVGVGAMDGATCDPNDPDCEACQ